MCLPRSRRWLTTLPQCGCVLVRQVLEGELAQRAEKTRQLREIQKQLMLLGGLVPPSPLVTQQAGAAPHSPRSTEDNLVVKQQRLQQDINRHSEAIRVSCRPRLFACQTRQPAALLYWCCRMFLALFPP
jgi:hypothetical protein